MYPFNDDSFAIEGFLDLLRNLFGSIFTCVVIDGYITAFTCEFYGY